MFPLGMKLNSTVPPRLSAESAPLDALTRQTYLTVCSGMSWAAFLRKVLPALAPLSGRDYRLLFSVIAFDILIFGVNDVSPVKVASFESVDESLGRCNVCGNGNVVNVTESE